MDDMFAAHGVRVNCVCPTTTNTPMLGTIDKTLALETIKTNIKNMTESEALLRSVRSSF